jgi:hypothetical protein
LLRPATDALPGNRQVPVPLVAIDELEIRRPVRFIKLDVEGAEPQAIQGASRILREDRPFILSELHPAQLERASGITPGDFLEQLRRLGYRARNLDGGVLDEPDPESIVSVVFVPQ